MKLRLALLLAIIALFTIGLTVWGQVDSVIGQFTNSPAESFAGSISGDGRFVVFESRGNLATENPDNADNNIEVFLWDYAQRRIFQITRTKSVTNNHFGPPIPNNIRVDIQNKRPQISNDGKWIAFASNAYSETPCGSNSTDPSNFDGNACTSPVPTPTPTPQTSPSPTPTPSVSPTPTPNNNPLIADANVEIWLYRIPDYAPADLTSGEELPLTDLAAGTFTRVTDTPASRPPLAATASTAAQVADDNHDPSISDHGEAISFTSTRDIIFGSNSFPSNDNDEIFVYRRTAAGRATEGGGIGGAISQVTLTPRGPISAPIYSKNSTISGDGTRIVFASTGDDPVPAVQPSPLPTASPLPSPLPSPPPALDCGSNPSTSRNEEIFYVTLAASGAPTACRQITTTTPTNPGDPVNVLDLGRRMSRDGRYVAFDSFADLAGENSGTNYTSFASYLFDAAAPPAMAFRRFLPRSDADPAAAGGDVPRFPGFTDYDQAGTPSTMLLETRLNIKPDGTIATTASEGLNPDPVRPVQIYKTSQPLLPGASPTPTASPAAYTRLSKFPISQTLLAFTQPLPSNSSSRFAFNLALTELGTGNQDGQSEVYYFYLPAEINSGVASFNFATGASRMPVTASPVPTASPTPSPSPTATPTATPTPSPTPTGSPTATPTPVPTPTPITPPAVFGLSPGSLAILDYNPNIDRPVVARTAVGSLQRAFTLPISLSGVTMSINGIACGLKSVSRRQIVFVLPPLLASTVTGTQYPFVINNNGAVFRGMLTIVPARPDIFTDLPVPGPFGRAQVTNVTNRVHTTEPFNVTTIRVRGGTRVPTVLRLRLTGVANIPLTSAQGGFVFIRIGNQTISGTQILTGSVLVEPGVYTFDFLLPAALNMAGDQPIVVTVRLSDGTEFTSRLDDTAPRLTIL